LNKYLSDKCRVLVTHQIQFLKDVQQIYVINNNSIQISGNFQQLKDQGLDFNELLKAYEKKEEKEEEKDAIIIDDDDDEEEQIQDNQQTRKESIARTEKSEVAQDDTIVRDDTMAKDTTEKFTSKEKIDKGELKLKDWWNFFKYGTGIIGFLLIMFFTTLGALLFVVISYWVGIWTKEDKEEQRNPIYFNLFYGIILFYFLIIFIRSIFITGSNIITSRNLHKLMIEKVLRAPIQFFDNTPIGRILTRLSQDISCFDFLLPLNMSFVLNNG